MNHIKDNLKRLKSGGMSALGAEDDPGYQPNQDKVLEMLGRFGRKKRNEENERAKSVEH